MEELKAFLEKAVKVKASDLHLGAVHEDVEGRGHDLVIFLWMLFGALFRSDV